MAGLLVAIRNNKTSINHILPVGSRVRKIPVSLVWPESKCQPGKLLVDVVDPVVEAGEDRLDVVPDLLGIPLRKLIQFQYPTTSISV